jgi:Asp-tRNA(Asn)/Glu-tRNA(Gln) amidotransferase A subunit family amidase
MRDDCGVPGAMKVGGRVSDLLDALRRGEVSASEVVSAHLAALRQVDVQTHAVAFFEDERALTDAAGLDRAFALDGITIMTTSAAT